MRRCYLHPGRAVDHFGWGAYLNLTSTVEIWSLKSLQITPFQISLGSLGVLLWSSRTVSSATKLHPTFHQHAGRWWLGLDFWVNCYFEGATATFFFMFFMLSHTQNYAPAHTVPPHNALAHCDPLRWANTQSHLKFNCHFVLFLCEVRMTAVISTVSNEMFSACLFLCHHLLFANLSYSNKSIQYTKSFQLYIFQSPGWHKQMIWNEKSNTPVSPPCSLSLFVLLTHLSR